jgi:FkbM family methyltransferase
MSRRLTRKHFDLIEVALLFLVGCAVGLLLTRWWTRSTDADWLRDAYGPDKHSFNVEEWVIRDFFKDKRNGVFVDVGSADARNGSNTFYLESKLGWSGIAVDALSEYGESYKKFRPQTRFYVGFVGDTSQGRITMYVSPTRTESSSFSKPFADFYATSPVQSREVPTVRLTDLLDDAGVTTVNFVSMDIELAEPKALAGFEIERFRPDLVCIEAQPVIRQQLLDYFTGHHYVPVGKYLLADTTNFYFMPLERR